jgi:D-glycero-alpha-D-manno-heptose 1-phosphate guanylyltransferase
MQPTEAVILAGGLGTRLRQAVPDLPKPMAPVNGRPFLEHQIDYWIEQGLRRFVLSVGFRQEQIVSHFGQSYRGCEIVYAQEHSPLGTGGGLLLAVEKLEAPDPFLVLNGDTYFEVSLPVLADFHRSREADLTIALFATKNNERYMGVQLEDDGAITSFESEPGAGQFANGGVYLMGRTLFASLPWKKGEKLSLENDLFRQFYRAGRKIRGCVCAGRFIDIGVPEDYYRAGEILEAHKV